MIATAAAQKHVRRLMDRYPPLHGVQEHIERALDLLITTITQGGTIFTAGNGGSAADAIHIVGELMKRFELPRPLSPDVTQALSERAMPREIRERLLSGLEMPLPARSLVEETSLATAFSNDVDPHLALSQQLLGSYREGDLLLAISTSGRSENIIIAAHLATALHLPVIALTGGDGGDLKEIADVAIVAPGRTTAEIQEYHLPIYHSLCAALEAHFFSETSSPRSS